MKVPFLLNKESEASWAWHLILIPSQLNCAEKGQKKREIEEGSDV